MTIDRGNLRRIMGYAAIALFVAAPALYVAALVREYYVPVPFVDEWSISYRTLRTGDYFAQHNEHRPLLPVLLLTTIARSTGWNLRFEPVLNFLFVLVSIAALFVLVRSRERIPGPAEIAAVAAASMFFFSPTQFDVWLWPWMITSTLAVAFLCSSAAFLCAERRYAFTLAVACAVAASFTSAQGLFTWIALLPVVAWDTSRNRLHRVRTYTWITAAIVSFVIYFRGYKFTESTNPFGNLLEHPSKFLEFVFSVLGAPWTRVDAFAASAGSLQMFLLGWIGFRLIRRGESVSRVLACLGIGVWALLFAAASASGRLHYGIGTALTSRYIASSAVLPAAFFAMVALAVRRDRRVAAWVASGTIVLSLAVWMIHLDKSMRAWEESFVERTRGALCLSMSDRLRLDDSPCLELLFPTPQTLVDAADYAEQIGLRTFRRNEPVPMVSGEWTGRVIGIAPAETEHRSRVTGVVVNPLDTPNPGLVFLDVGSEKLWCCGFTRSSDGFEIETNTGARRVRSWEATIPTSLLPPDGGVVGYALIEAPDRLVRFETLPPRISPGRETVYSATQAVD